MTTGDKIRDIKRPYRKKALQTGYAQAGKAVVNHPLTADPLTVAVGLAAEAGAEPEEAEVNLPWASTVIAE